ncbi:hypothetical protein [Nocardioides luteus]|uniref:hypothetical protein n=1 Tax=Nocardioides luteus TaxID=1844 RepID=UPI0018C95E77|nr:hypothetical protein [Nocardioides luteus]MBG6098789.1 hypothetical protein [Nocardioides luteus]
MNRYGLDMAFLISSEADTDVVEKHLWAVLDHLHELDGVIDPDLLAHLGKGQNDAKVVYTMFVDAKTPPEALNAGLVAVRTAVHACEGSTTGWEDLFRTGEQTVRPTDAEDLDGDLAGACEA